jgi:predicted nucleotidyltransferase component of viral defense system
MSENSIDLMFMPSNTKTVFERLAMNNFISKYVLVGGTALSLQIRHRLSEDLDFIFDGEKLNANSIKRNIAAIFPDYRIIRQELNWQIDLLISNVRVTFFSTGAIALPFKVQDHSFSYKTIHICSALTIASLKMSAIAQRNTIRDYYDLYILAKNHFSLKEIIGHTIKLLPNLSPITYTETLIYTSDIEEISIGNHLMPNEVITKDLIAEFFIHEIRKIKEEID